MEDGNEPSHVPPDERDEGSSWLHTKRSEAARIARELATHGSWSANFVPVSEEERHKSVDQSTQQESTTVNSAHATDPPPAYSRTTFIHELPASPVLERPVLVIEQDQTLMRTSDAEAQAAGDSTDEATPLISLSRRRVSRRGWTPWVHRGKSKKQRYCRLILLLIVFGVIASVVLCSLLSANEQHGYPSAPSATFVPTGPRYELHETTQSITGAYKLYDRLELTTTTGSIDIEIEPQENRAPAILILQSDLGSISVRLSRNAPYSPPSERTIFSEFKSFSGSINAEILLGRGGYALVETTTGSQKLSILTFDAGFHDSPSNLSTSSHTGSQNILVTALNNKPVTNLWTTHQSLFTGDLEVFYPPSWFGKLGIRSAIGSFTVEGKDLMIDKKDKFQLNAHRGLANSSVSINSLGTGRVRFVC